MYDIVQPTVSQWDGSEFQIALDPWGLPHSSRTLSEQRGQYFKRATMAAFMESKKLWTHDVAVEFSFSDSGLGPWPGDMEPFADEGRISPPGDLCNAGDAWHLEMLQRMLLSGTDCKPDVTLGFCEISHGPLFEQERRIMHTARQSYHTCSAT